MNRNGFVSAVIDVFEEFLSEKRIPVPNPEKAGEKDEALIFGSDYYGLEDRISELLSRYEAEMPVPYGRLSELATMFKDGLIEDDEEEAMRYFSEECMMTEEEYAYFGIERPDHE